MAGIVHIAGPDLQVGAQLRQRCGWCGADLLDYDLDRIAVPDGQDPRPATWPVGALVEVDGPMKSTVEHVDGEQLPANACAQRDLTDRPDAGPMTRHEFLERVHDILRPAAYLEIGVQHGWSLQLAKHSTLAIGIDPNPQLLVDVGQARLFQTTSDEFFAHHPAELKHHGMPPVDLAFIDGLHHHDAALRDFIGVERLSHTGAVVILDDVLPTTQAMAARAPCPGDWTGDVWKLIPILRRWRPDLHCTLVDTQPTGLLVVRRLDPTSRALYDAYDAILTRWPAADAPVPDQILHRTLAMPPDVALADLKDWSAAT